MIKIILFSITLLMISKTLYSIQEIYPYISPDICTSSQYFDPDLFRCVGCDYGFVKSVDGLSCSCVGLNKYITNDKNSSKQQCLKCKLTEYSSNNMKSCVPRNCFKMPNGKTTCSLCKKNQIIVTNHQNGSILQNVQCITCSPGYTPSSDRTHCQLCVGNQCDCDLKQYTLLNDICIPNTFVRNITVYKPKLISGEYIDSEFIKTYSVSSAYLCSLKNKTACQMYANICVMSLYNDDKNSPCDKWRNTKRHVTPILMYDEDESYSVMFRKKIGIVYSLSSNSENNHIDIIASKFNIKGEYSNVIEENSKWLVQCPSIWKLVNSDILRFGVNYRHKCKIGIQQLLTQVETNFYEAYVKFTDVDNKESVTQLHAVPVLIKGDLINFNKDSEINNLQLVKRFYIFDKTSGVVNLNGKEYLKYFRYAEYIEIKIRIRKKGKGERSKIYTPIIILHYAEKNEFEIKENDYVNMEFLVKFELEETSMVNSMEIAIGALSAFVVLYSILQSWSHIRRSGKIGIDIFTVIQFLIFVAGNLSNTFYLVSFGASTFSFLVYKTQKVIYMVVPTDRDEHMIKTCLIVAFTLKIIELLAVNWQQINVDICFIDWEKSNSSTNEIGAKHSNVQGESQPSFWRPYFVANEWNELQTMRKISLPLQVLACVFVLEIFGASSWTNIGFDISPENPSGHLSPPSYQFALSGLIYLLLYFIQLIISMLIYERYIENSILDFMDVCSIANVSMLILDQSLHGYYLHGRCVYASCDTDVRGLQPGLPVRGFSVRCTNEFRMYFTRLSMHMVSKNKWQWQHHINFGNEQANINASTTSDSFRRSSAKSSKKGNDSIASMTASPLQTAVQHRAQAANLVNKFLTAFFDHALEDLDYEVREKRYIESLFDIEVINEGNYKTLLLYNTMGDTQTFQKAIWYGQEWTLATFDLYTFCLVQMITGNYVLAALVCVIVWKFLNICRQYGGKKNLAKKTLIDERFLI